MNLRRAWRIWRRQSGDNKHKGQPLFVRLDRLGRPKVSKLALRIVFQFRTSGLVAVAEESMLMSLLLLLFNCPVRINLISLCPRRDFYLLQTMQSFIIIIVVNQP